MEWFVSVNPIMTLFIILSPLTVSSACEGIVETTICFYYGK